ncbi:hypothetical protein [Sphingomonas solaris]|uniref:Uncharacterized protein n=1 Tax=Alterirhizorhabdus solaris TaxID=2529389 RepID=A0A558QSL0_9SPHN|nr:hypothetical protein [Sphingomonas solaris]TVV70130.1 hypothetical protein FOY91_19825 [Sphingomonas solaris]
MSQEPAFPADAVPGAGAAALPPATTASHAGNDAVADASPANPGGELAGAGEAIAAASALKSNLWPAAGVAIGIGSAAVAAALLYRGRRS